MWEHLPNCELYRCNLPTQLSMQKVNYHAVCLPFSASVISVIKSELIQYHCIYSVLQYYYSISTTTVVVYPEVTDAIFLPWCVNSVCVFMLAVHCFNFDVMLMVLVNTVDCRPDQGGRWRAWHCSYYSISLVSLSGSVTVYTGTQRQSGQGAKLSAWTTQHWDWDLWNGRHTRGRFEKSWTEQD